MTHNLTCKDAMVEHQETLHPTDTVTKAFQLMRKKGMRFLPVVENDGTYVGVFTSPTMIKLLLPRAVQIQLDDIDDSSIKTLKFLQINKEMFHHSLAEEKDEPVINHLSDAETIPMAEPDTPIMESILLLHKFKRHVVILEPETNRFVGVVSNNSVLKRIFDENHTI